jgi:hypothetical protein
MAKLIEQRFEIIKDEPVYVTYWKGSPNDDELKNAGIDPFLKFTREDCAVSKIAKVERWVHSMVYEDVLDLIMSSKNKKDLN